MCVCLGELSLPHAEKFHDCRSIPNHWAKSSFLFPWKSLLSSKGFVHNPDIPLFPGWKQFYFDIIRDQMEGSHMLIAPAKQVTVWETRKHPGKDENDNGLTKTIGYSFMIKIMRWETVLGCITCFIASGFKLQGCNINRAQRAKSLFFFC